MTNTPEFDQWLKRHDPDQPEPIISLVISPAECIQLANLCDKTPFADTTAYAQLKRDQDALRVERQLYQADMTHPKHQQAEVSWWDRPLSASAILVIYAAFLLAGYWAFMLIRSMWHG